MLLPVFLQTLLGYTAMRSGLVLSPGGLVIALSMPLVDFLLSKVEARWLVIFGLCVSAFGLFDMAGFSLDVDYRTAMLARVVQTAGLAFLFVPINTMAFAFVAKEKMGSATGLMMKAFVDNFWLLGVIFLAVIPLMFFVKRVAPHRGAVMVE